MSTLSNQFRKTFRLNNEPPEKKKSNSYKFSYSFIFSDNIEVWHRPQNTSGDPEDSKSYARKRKKKD
jgi:hypothetical protein